MSLKKKLSCFGCLLKQKRSSKVEFFFPTFSMFFLSSFLTPQIYGKISLLFLLLFCWTSLFLPPNFLLFLTLSFCCCRALVVVVVVVFVLCGLNPLLSSVLCLQYDDSKTNNTICNNNVRNIRVLELRGAENEEGNRGEVTRWFETIGISRVRFRRVCHGR